MRTMVQIGWVAGFLLLSGCGQVQQFSHRMQSWWHGGTAKTSSVLAQNSMAVSESDWMPEKNKNQSSTTIKFSFDQSGLTAEAKRQLRQEASWVLDHPGATLHITGHTDERGSREYNLALGWRRARAVSRYLAQMGVPASRTDLMSYGKEKPLDWAHRADAWAKNRRVECAHREAKV